MPSPQMQHTKITEWLEKYLISITSSGGKKEELVARIVSIMHHFDLTADHLIDFANSPAGEKINDQMHKDFAHLVTLEAKNYQEFMLELNRKRALFYMLLMHAAEHKKKQKNHVDREIQAYIDQGLEYGKIDAEQNKAHLTTEIPHPRKKGAIHDEERVMIEEVITELEKDLERVLHIDRSLMAIEEQMTRLVNLRREMLDEVVVFDGKNYLLVPRSVPLERLEPVQLEYAKQAYHQLQPEMKANYRRYAEYQQTRQHLLSEKVEAQSGAELKLSALLAGMKAAQFEESGIDLSEMIGLFQRYQGLHLQQYPSSYAQPSIPAPRFSPAPLRQYVAATYTKPHSNADEKLSTTSMPGTPEWKTQAYRDALKAVNVWAANQQSFFAHRADFAVKFNYQYANQQTNARNFSRQTHGRANDPQAMFQRGMMAQLAGIPGSPLLWNSPAQKIMQQSMNTDKSKIYEESPYSPFKRVLSNMRFGGRSQ